LIILVSYLLRCGSMFNRAQNSDLQNGYPKTLMKGVTTQYENGRLPTLSVDIYTDFSEELSRRLARYHRTIALFQSPLSERSVTVSVSRALSSSQSCRLAATCDLQHHFWLSAFRVPHGGFGLTTCAPSPLGWLSHPRL
jgi:hypothetical protein